MRPGALRFLLFTVIACAAAACAEIPREEPPAIGVSSMFDPATNAIPLPNDLLKDPKTGLLAIPASAGDSELTKEVKGSLGRLDGWLTSQTPTIPFDGPLDAATLTAQTVLVFDITGGTATKIDPASYFTAFNVGVTPAGAAPYNLMIKNKKEKPEALSLPKGYTQGHEYFIVVTDGVKGKDGKPITANAVFDLLKCTTPIADDKGRSLTLLGPTGDKKTDDEITAELIQLETARAKVYDPAFKAVEPLGVTRANAAAFTAFSVQGGPRAVFNPTLVGKRLPDPNDLSGPANAPLDVKPSIYFDLPLDAATVAAGVKMHKLSGGTPTPVTVGAEAAATADDTGYYKVTVTPAAKLEPSTTYLVVTDDAILGANKIRTAALAYFSIVRYLNPLVSGDCNDSASKKTLNSPFLDNTIDLVVTTGYDPATATADQWKTAFDFLIQNLCDLEKLRVAYGPLFTAAAAGGTPRENVTALWSFTTAAQ